MAETVGRPVYELEEELPLGELLEWRAYWKWVAEQKEKAAERARREAKARGKRL